MPITRLEGGKDWRKAGPQVRQILGEIADWIETREKATITPSSGIGQIRPDGKIDLTAANDRITALEKG